MFDNFIVKNYTHEKYRTVKLLLLEVITAEGMMPQYVHFHAWKFYFACPTFWKFVRWSQAQIRGWEAQAERETQMNPRIHALWHKVEEQLRINYKLIYGWFCNLDRDYNLPKLYEPHRWTYPHLTCQNSAEIYLIEM